MKKMKIVIVGLTAGVLVAGVSALALQKKQVVKTVADTETNHYMPFESSFTGYSGLGAVKDTDFASWSGRFNALDRFFTGESSGIGEDLTGHFDSVSWQQKKSHPYVYFTLAGNASNTVEVRKVSDPDAATPVASVNNDQFNGNPMVMNYIEIDTSSLAEGEELFLRLCDNSTTDYGFLTFGYLHVNASATDVSTAIWTHINSLTTEYAPDNREAVFRIRQTMNFYLNGKAAGLLSLSSSKNVSANEDFESNAGFLQRWYRDTEYDDPNLNENFTKSWNTIISGADHHWNNNNMPFNKTDDGFFKGYYEDNTGFVATDEARYRFVSKPFVLSGTGFISIKMAGRPASLHVLRGNTELAFIDIKTFSTSGDAANITTGYNSCTMVRHVINLNAFLGQVIQIAIADVDRNGNWGAANYDELITKYDTVPSFKVDEAIQNSIHNYYLDKYVSSSNSDIIYVDEATREANPTDTSVVKEAHDFLDYYYANFRVPGSRFSFCEVGSDVKSQLVSSYNSLSKEAQAIVDESEDFDFGDERITGNWYDYSMREQYTVGEIVRYVAARWGISINVKNGGGLSSKIMSNMLVNPATLIIMISCVAIISSALFVFLRLKKKKEN